MLAQERDHTLRLAERIGADEMGALGKQRQRVEQFGDFQTRIGMAEDRQRKRRFGNEKIARHELEWRAGRIGHVLVVAGSHHAEAISLDQRLRRPEHVTRGMQRHFHAADGCRSRRHFRIGVGGHDSARSRFPRIVFE